MSRAKIWRLANYSCVAPSEAAWQRLTIFAALPSWVGALMLQCTKVPISGEVDLPPKPFLGKCHRRRTQYMRSFQGRTVDFSWPIPLSVDNFGPQQENQVRTAAGVVLPS